MTAVLENIRFSDGTVTFVDPSDNTKAFRIDCGTVTAGQTRVMTVPDSNWTGGSASSVPADDITVGDAAVSIATSSGNVSMTAIDETTVTVGNAAGDAYFRVAASATAGSEDVRIVNTNGTDAASVEVTSSAGGIRVRSGTTSAGTDIEGVQNFIVNEDTSSAATTTYSWSIAAQSVVFFNANIAVYNSTDNTSFSYVIQGQAERDEADNTAIIGANTSTSRGTLGGHSITITVDDANDEIDLNLVSASTDNLSWRGTIQIISNDTTLARTA